MNFRRDNSLIRPVSEISIHNTNYFIGLAIVPIIIICIVVLVLFVILGLHCKQNARIHFKHAIWVKRFLAFGAFAAWAVALGLSIPHARYDISALTEPLKEVGPELKNITIGECPDIQSDIDSFMSAISSFKTAMDGILSILGIASKVVDIVFLIRTILAGVIAGLTMLTIPCLYGGNVYSLSSVMLVLSAIIACVLYVIALASADLCFPDLDQTVVRLVGEIEGTPGGLTCSNQSTYGPIVALCYYQNCDDPNSSSFVEDYLTVNETQVPSAAETVCPGITVDVHDAFVQVNDALDNLKCENIPYEETIPNGFCNVQTKHGIQLFHAYISACAVMMFTMLAMILFRDPIQTTLTDEEINLLNGDSGKPEEPIFKKSSRKSQTILNPPPPPSTQITPLGHPPSVPPPRTSKRLSQTPGLQPPPGLPSIRQVTFANEQQHFN